MNCNEIKTLLKEKEEREVELKDNTLKWFDLIKDDIVRTIIKQSINNNFDKVTHRQEDVILSMCKMSDVDRVFLCDTIPAWLDDPFVYSYTRGGVKPDRVRSSEVFGCVDYGELHRMLNNHLKSYGFVCVFLAKSKFSWNSRYQTSRKKLLNVCCTNSVPKNDSASTQGNADSITLKIGLTLLVVFVLLCIF